MYYRTWKYWHAAMIHGKAIAVTVAYDLYKECCEGELDLEWRVRKPVDFLRFREKLASQMLGYDPRKGKYSGDTATRAYTQQGQSLRSDSTSRSARTPNPSAAPRPSSARTPSSVASSLTSGVTVGDVAQQTAAGRLCGDVTELQKHFHSIRKNKEGNKRVCVVCGARCSHTCTKCDKVMHMPICPKEGEAPRNTCFFIHHNAMCLGLSREDYKLRAQKRKHYQAPDLQTLQEHSLAMKRLRVDSPSIASTGNMAPTRPTRPSPQRTILPPPTSPTRPPPPRSPLASSTRDNTRAPHRRKNNKSNKKTTQ